MNSNRRPPHRPRFALVSAFALALFALCLSTGLARAACSGVNLLPELSAEARADIQARSDATPYSVGNFWRASRGGSEMTLIGTYHLEDARHAATIEAASGLIAAASALLVEAGPQDEQALKAAIGRDPALMFITSGPTLLQVLPPETWQQLSLALEKRGIPQFMAAKFRPWYAAMLLSMPACALQDMAEPLGLDRILVRLADDLAIPVQALEPFDTLFTLFKGLSPQQEQEMIESALAIEPRSEDFAITLADMYFAGESRMIWELTRIWSYGLPGANPAQVDEEMAVMEEAMMVRRNQAWIPVIEAAARQSDAPVVVAFGALHLSGEAGVLNLLAKAGWTLERIEF